MDSNQRPSAYEAPALPLSYVANLRTPDQPPAQHTTTILPPHPKIVNHNPAAAIPNLHTRHFASQPTFLPLTVIPAQAGIPRRKLLLR